MKRIRLMALVAAGLFQAACASRLDEKELVRFLDQREVCDHLRGEIPDPADRERLQEVIRDINKYCAGTDQQLKALKARFANDAQVMAKLNALEDRIGSGKH
jgi:hypothetical protein